MTQRTAYSSQELVDFRWQKTNYSLFFENTEIEALAKEFGFMIDRCNQFFEDNLDWWFEPLSSRNNFISPLFHHFVCFHICLKLAKESNTPAKCVTDSNAMHKGLLHLKKIGSWQGEIVHIRKRSFISLLNKRLTSACLTIVHTLIPFMILRLLKRPCGERPSEPITIIDTFMLPEHEKSNRYYDGILKKLTEEEKRSIRFVPSFYGYSFKQYFPSLSALRNQEERFLFKEDFLFFSDYLNAFAHSIRVFKVRPPAMRVKFFDLADQIEEELRLFGGLRDAVLGFLNFSFAKRLSKEGIQLLKAVDWNENQGQDRGWNYGMNKFYPQVMTVGYSPVFLSQWHLSASPLASERKKGILPKTMKVPSSYLVAIKKKNDPKLVAQTTGAFRFTIVTRSNSRNRNSLSVLVPLPLEESLCIHLCNEARKLASHSNQKLDLTFKLHPASNRALKNRLKLSAKRDVIEFWTNRTFHEELKEADVVIGSWTSALVEAAASGIAVGILSSPDGLYHNPIPNDVTMGMHIVLDSNDSFDLLLKKTKESVTSRNPIKHIDILEKPSRSAALELLGI
jgi:hypothetical protein